MLAGFVAHFRDQIVASDYREGCPVAPIVLELASTTPRLAAAVTRRGFEDLVATMSARLVEKGLQPEYAQELAALAVTGMEGALVVSRALQDPQPLEALTARLTEANRPPSPPVRTTDMHIQHLRPARRISRPVGFWLLAVTFLAFFGANSALPRSWWCISTVGAFRRLCSPRSSRSTPWACWLRC
ncbi:hypothetical protein [Streptomyces sp. NPDC002573]|uniref:LmrA/YxaF family transcription factor n=1 Tax=Streptomyces sp. NPDC002573 TaxID=3364651 RepID=UPI0036C25193